MGIRVARVIVFGSRARGDATDGSDTDFLIISPDFAGMNTRERLELLGVAAARIWEPVEALGHTPDELEEVEAASLLEEVLRTGVPLV